jgi:hypothetical protein
LVLLRGDARHRRQRYRHHGGIADDARQPCPRCCGRAVGRKRLSRRLRRLHCARRRRFRPLWRPPCCGGRPCAVCRCVGDHCAFDQRDHAADGSRLAGPRLGACGPQHTCSTRHRHSARASPSRAFPSYACGECR